jgi:SAM-dependent methyltransferase
MSSESFSAEQYWHDRLAETYGLQGVGHTELSRSYNEWLYRVRRRNFLHIARLYDLGSTPRVLDIGSGTGFYVALWEKLGASEIVGLDIADVAVDQLAERFPQHEFHKADISDPLPETIDTGFDVISGMDVFFHIVDDTRFSRALQNVFSLLRPGGFFLFTGNFLRSETKRSEHIIHRSLSVVEETLDDIGFTIVDRQPVFVLMNDPVDDPGPLIRRLWSYIRHTGSRGETAGFLLGAVLYPIEVMLSRILSESPTTEMMVCRKPSPA